MLYIHDMYISVSVVLEQNRLSISEHSRNIEGKMRSDLEICMYICLERNKQPFQGHVLIFSDYIGLIQRVCVFQLVVKFSIFF